MLIPVSQVKLVRWGGGGLVRVRDSHTQAGRKTAAL